MPPLRRLLRDTVRGFTENDLLTFASAIAFQVLTAVVPLLLFGLALLGFLHVSAAWSDTLAPQVRHHVSREVFALVDSFVRTALGSKQLFWLTLGGVLCVWETSGAIRAIMSALSRVYGDEEERTRRRRYAISFALSVTTIVFALSAFAVVRFGPDVLHGPVGVIGRWPVGIALLLALVWLLLRYAPVESHAAHWVSFGSGLCVTAWLGTSLVFGIYVGYVADYGSLFSTLAGVFVLMAYLYLSACAFLAGAQVDALLRDRAGVSRAECRPSPGAAATPPPAR